MIRLQIEKESLALCENEPELKVIAMEHVLEEEGVEEEKIEHSQQIDISVSVTSNQLS